MAEKFDEDALKLKRLKNFLSLLSKQLEQLHSKEFELPEAKRLELLRATAGYITALDTSSLKNPSSVELEVQKLKDRLENIKDVLRNLPVNMATYGLIAKLATDSSENLKAVEFHIEKMDMGNEKRRRGYAAKENNWLEQLDNHPEWMEQIPRGKGMGWKVPATVIERVLVNQTIILNI